LLKVAYSITLLVAIAEAARSLDYSISSQIPPSLRESRTLVLCPAGLIDNWMDELLTWDPDRVLGDYRKVDSSLRSVQLRLQVINSWHKNGGVLILGYNLFRDMIHNEGTKTRDPPLTPEEHTQAQEQLLKGPRIIVADEAHIMKNSQAKITSAASQFESKSRIALTGSPLANNIEEYHTMINWVAPDYLGPIAEFRDKYVEPIQQGLYCDSTPYERRQSLKMLGVLKEDLSPKVHRADVSVLRHDLQPKTEFVITVPLTDLQIQAYSLYVQSMSGKTSELTKSGQLKQTTLWHWLGILSLLCNHPVCFRDKLSKSEKAAKSKKRNDPAVIATSDDDPLAGTTPVWKVGVSEELIRQEMELFLNFGSTLEAIEHSYKVKVLLQILDWSRAAGDKVLVFSSSIPTLDHLEQLCRRTGRKFARLDGETKMNTRQASTKEFNTGDTELYLISTGAGGLGLNLPGANRVIIFDFRFNPVNEEQAVGRAYRIGQKKPVFVYRFVAGGTFEELIHNKAVFKMQLSSRVVDKKNPIAWATRQVGEFLFEPKTVVQQDLSGFKGKDPQVLDKILENQAKDQSIRAIVMTDTFYRHDNEVLTAEEQKEVKQLLSDEQLKRSNPKAWHILNLRRAKEAEAKHAEAAMVARAQMSPAEQAILAGIPYTRPYTALQHGLPVASIDPLLAGPGQSVAPPLPSSVAPSPVQDVRVHHAPSANMPDMSPIAGANTRIRSPTPMVDSHSTRIPDIVYASAPSKPKSGAERGVQSYDAEASLQTQPPLQKRKGFTTPVRNANLSPIRGTRTTSASDTREDADKLLQTAISRASRKSDSPPGLKDSIPEEVVRVVARSIRQVIEKDDPTQWPSKVQTIAKHLVQDPKLVGDIISRKVSAIDVAAMNFASISVGSGRAQLADDISKSDNSNVGNLTHPSQSPPQNNSPSDKKKMGFFQSWFG
jgi:superfamily II DNA or RNA helicase